MSDEDKDRFQLSNICWTYNKLFNVEDDKDDIIIIQQENIEVQHTGVVILILN